ncbi:phosphate acyltransferase [Cellvibrio zantedeschiae]|uniref:Phosphate acyltransferase n=2 Tax=Cellvibrio zantedeschiae TaxID=1237077 RepID=A0ABQ3AY57_9GAMM|nr:phosphate acyltransferase [Cellvibrio zantedeschiae]
MSGDLGPRVAISAAQNFTARFTDVDIVLVGNEQQLLTFSSVKKLSRQRISILNATEVVAMDEDPLHALRHKKSSSMWLAIQTLNNNDTDACVSAGNTGALLAMGKYLLKTFPGVERPAICKAMPVEQGQTYLLDLGANTNCTPEQLYQFALMGKILASSTNTNPRVGLLNIGTESTKGTEVIKAAQDLLQDDSRLNFAGYIEANKIFTGEMDVIVCDGFHGNVALKTCEGTARFIAKKIQAAFKRNWFTRIAGGIIWPLLKQLRTELDPSMYNGASFLGLQKVLVKSHGNANKRAFMQALIVAREQVIQNIPARIQQELSNESFSSQQ